MIQYRTGNIFDIKQTDHVVVAHIVNDVGAFGRGFAAAVAERWPMVKTHYHANFSWYRLGDVLVSNTDMLNVSVANLFAQDGLPSKENPVPIKYLALAAALGELGEIILECSDEYEIWMPRIGTGYARGKWDVIESIIRTALTDKGIRVVVFDQP